MRIAPRRKSYTGRVGALLLFGAFAPVAVLAPLGYGPGCWSVVELQNLAGEPVRLAVEGHKGSGALVALGGARLLKSLLFGTQANDPWTLALAGAVLLAAAGVAGWGPAREAARIDPLAALRRE